MLVINCTTILWYSITCNISKTVTPSGCSFQLCLASCMFIPSSAPGLHQHMDPDHCRGQGTSMPISRLCYPREISSELQLQGQSRQSPGILSWQGWGAGLHTHDTWRVLPKGVEWTGRGSNRTHEVWGQGRRTPSPFLVCTWGGKCSFCNCCCSSENSQTRVQSHLLPWSPHQLQEHVRKWGTSQAEKQGFVSVHLSACPWQSTLLTASGTGAAGGWKGTATGDPCPWDSMAGCGINKAVCLPPCTKAKCCSTPVKVYMVTPSHWNRQVKLGGS